MADNRMFESLSFVRFGSAEFWKHVRTRRAIVALYPITYKVQPAADTRNCLAMKV